MWATIATRAEIILIKSGRKTKEIDPSTRIHVSWLTDIMWQTALHFPHSPDVRCTQSCKLLSLRHKGSIPISSPEDEILPIMLLPYCLQFPKLRQCQNYLIPFLQWHLSYTMLTNFFQQVSSATLSNYLGTHTILKSSTFGCVPGTSPFQCVH